MEEIGQCGIKRVPPVDKGKIDPCSQRFELSQCQMRIRFPEFNQISKTCHLEVVHPDAFPLSTLEGVDSDVMKAAAFLQRFANEQCGNSECKADFQCGLRLSLPDQDLKEPSNIRSDGRVERKDFRPINRAYLFCAEDFFE